VRFGEVLDPGFADADKVKIQVADGEVDAPRHSDDVTDTVKLCRGDEDTVLVLMGLGEFLGVIEGLGEAVYDARRPVKLALPDRVVDGDAAIVSDGDALPLGRADIDGFDVPENVSRSLSDIPAELEPEVLFVAVDESEGLRDSRGDIEDEALAEGVFETRDEGVDDREEDDVLVSNDDFDDDGECDDDADTDVERLPVTDAVVEADCRAVCEFVAESVELEVIVDIALLLPVCDGVTVVVEVNFFTERVPVGLEEGEREKTAERERMLVPLPVPVFSADADGKAENVLDALAETDGLVIELGVRLEVSLAALLPRPVAVEDLEETPEPVEVNIALELRIFVPPIEVVAVAVFVGDAALLARDVGVVEATNTLTDDSIDDDTVAEEDGRDAVVGIDVEDLFTVFVSGPRALALDEAVKYIVTVPSSTLLDGADERVRPAGDSDALVVRL
jgi:hypothetical protein